MRISNDTNIIGNSPPENLLVETGSLILHPEQLNSRANKLAHEHVVAVDKGNSYRLLERVEEDYRSLNSAQRIISEWVRNKVPLSRSVEWLLDNSYIIHAQVRDIRRNMPSHYYRELPKLTGSNMRGYPRIYGIAKELISLTDGAINEEKLRYFIHGYQVDTSLGIGELWALPTMAQIALLQKLNQLIQQIVEGQQQRSKADKWANKLFEQAKKDSRHLAAIIARYDASREPLNVIFAVHLLQRFLDLGPEGQSLLRWLDDRLARQGMNFDQVTRMTHQNDAANLASVSNCITSLRFISDFDWADFVESVSRLEEALNEDPAGIYPLMDFATRDRYRHVVEKLAKSSCCIETHVARQAVSLAQQAANNSVQPVKRHHVGYYLIDRGRGELCSLISGRSPSIFQRVGCSVKSIAQPIYPVAVIIVTIILAAIMLALANVPNIIEFWITLLFLIVPCSELAINFICWATRHVVPPHRLPKLELKTGIPDHLRTVVVVHTILNNIRHTEDLLRQLEVYYLANQEENLHFALLGDFPDAKQQHLPHERKLIEQARRAVEELNNKYQAPAKVFYLFQRKRQWNNVEKKWMGWERKRGKLEEFNRLLRGSKDTSFDTIVGDLATLQRVRFVITLDEDTNLPRDAAKRLIGTLAHPINQAVFDESGTRVIEGYGVLQPRVAIGVTSANRTMFATIFANQIGVDPYPTAISDLYQDLFDEGIYMGKGIYDIDTFITMLDNTLPENSVLSHDLLEGTHVRAGMVTDIELVDHYPAHYLASAVRTHRWVRGDWQLLPWLFPKLRNPAGKLIDNPLNLISRWKIVDNLRRSLTAPASFLLLAAGLTILPGGWHLWAIFTIISLVIPILSYLTEGLLINLPLIWYGAYRRLFPNLGLLIRQTVLSLVLLPHQAWVMSDAIVRTLWRLFVSHRQLLEWETADSAERRLQKGIRGYLLVMWPAVVMALILTVAMWQFDPIALRWTSPLLLCWMASGIIAWQVSKERVYAKEPINQRDRDELLNIARNTWNFFAEMVGPVDHFLPPDNYQEATNYDTETSKEGIIAHRTSPTNIGMYLLSVLAAFDLRFISLPEMLERISHTMDTLYGMVRVSGHWFNWYDTLTTEPLHPKYISTVDSGNLIGSFIALKQGLLAIINQPEATLALALSVAPDDPAMHDTVKKMRDSADDLVKRLQQWIMEMDFSMLYDVKRGLFYVGYQVENDKLDNSYYDLLASEARMASFVAIAKGDVPEKHWFRLGRQFTQIGSLRTLLSWSGTMFEYLMPLLMMRNYPSCLLDETYSAVLQRQQSYAADLGLPWGVSESGFNARDMQYNYSYMAFGTPGLGVKRGLADDYVVAPYATMLALAVNPAEAMRNIRRLIPYGMANRYGLYEAIDYTHDRLPDGQKFAIVRSEMAHHQGMSLLAITNALLENVMQQRFHAEPMVRATELLLQERLPHYVVTAENPATDVKYRISNPVEAPVLRRFTSPDTLEPEGHLLSNGNYSVLLTAAGSGYSSCDGLSLTRWRSDPTKDNWGSYCYLRDLEQNVMWSATSHPLSNNNTVRALKPEKYQVSFSSDRVEYYRQDGDIETQMSVTVTPEHNAEVRRIVITNNGRKARRLEITSYCEVVLSSFAADLAHPAFNKLFVNTEHVAMKDALICTRRQHDSPGKTPYLLHVFAYADKAFGHTRYETDRVEFIGRGRNTADPQAMDQKNRLKNSDGAVLDPILSLRRRLRLNAGETVSVYFTTALAYSRAQALELIDFYHLTENADHAFSLAWAHSQMELRYLQMTPEKAHTAQRLSSRLLYPSMRRRSQAEVIAHNNCGQAGLWAEGISGDLPIILVRISRVEESELISEVLQAHAYLRLKGLICDLVILNDQQGGYLQVLRDRLRTLLTDSLDSKMENQNGGVFIKQTEVLSNEAILTLTAAARVVLYGNLGSMQRQLELNLLEFPLPKKTRPWPVERNFLALPLPREELLFANGTGGFTADGREYHITLTENETTPAPWVNVLANPDFGSIISESGGGYSWSENSHEHRLTPWFNDPVSDPSGEAIYLRDELSGIYWSPTPAPVRDVEPYRIRHGQGYSIFEHYSHGISQQMTVFVPIDQKAKIYRIRLKNEGGKPRVLSVTGYLEWVLGVDRNFTAPFLVTAVDEATGLLTARNSYQSANYAARIAFWDVIGSSTHTFTSDRTEFIGRNGSLSSPAALGRVSLSGRTGAGVDSCAAQQVKITLNPQEEKEISFVLGEGDDLEQARATALHFREEGAIEKDYQRLIAFWDEQLGALQVSTPDTALNIMLNRWVLYQTISCRIWGRSGYYQSGGAYGFRDQLQDMLAMIYSNQAMIREHLLRAASRQFEEGDVQHWWHPPTGVGVRTRCSDDYLWLPYVTAEYLAASNDNELLETPISFLHDALLDDHEEDRYNTPTISLQQGTMYDHCLRSLERGMKLLGQHGLPLIGSGDWNDGMSMVGRQGVGESIWLGWFLVVTMRKFAKIAKTRGDNERANWCLQGAEKLLTAINEHGWDGKWYRRAFTDAGELLGSEQNEECRIDSIAQSWAVLADPENPRSQQALDSLMEQLLMVDEKLVLLLTPPFDTSALNPGYIKDYPPGVRENGGQYTHAAVWVALAAAKLGKGDTVANLISWLNPINHAIDVEAVEKYKVEPYVVTGDVYSVYPHIGRGGWSWYTGSAAWLYRVSVEALLGLTIVDGYIELNPCIPASWSGFQMSYRYMSTVYQIQVDNPHRVNNGVKTIMLDDNNVEGGRIPQVDDGKKHHLRVILAID